MQQPLELIFFRDTDTVDYAKRNFISQDECSFGIFLSYL